jgi:hypothetical protein
MEQFTLEEGLKNEIEYFKRLLKNDQE